MGTCIPFSLLSLLSDFSRIRILSILCNKDAHTIDTHVVGIDERQEATELDRQLAKPSFTKGAAHNFYFRQMLTYFLEYLDSLDFPEMKYRQDEVLNARADSCAWIFQHKDYKRWIADEHGLLWILGKAGSGKSTLMKRMFQAFYKVKTRPADTFSLLFSSIDEVLDYNKLLLAYSGPCYINY